MIASLGDDCDPEGTIVVKFRRSSLRVLTHLASEGPSCSSMTAPSEDDPEPAEEQAEAGGSRGLQAGEVDLAQPGDRRPLECEEANLDPAERVTRSG